MCSQSVSGSSLLSGYNEDDARETSGRSRREFEEIDAVLYNEEKAKRLSIKKICEEWSSKPHFRVRGRLHHIQRPIPINLIHSFNHNDEIPSISDLLTTTNPHDLNVRLIRFLLITQELVVRFSSMMLHQVVLQSIRLKVQN